MTKTESEKYFLHLGRLLNYEHEVVSTASVENQGYPLPGIEKRSIIITVPDPDGEVARRINQARAAGQQIILTTRIEHYKELQNANYIDSLVGQREFEPGMARPYVLIYADLLLRWLENRT